MCHRDTQRYQSLTGSCLESFGLKIPELNARFFSTEKSSFNKLLRICSHAFMKFNSFQ